MFLLESISLKVSTSDLIRLLLPTHPEPPFHYSNGRKVIDFV